MRVRMAVRLLMTVKPRGLYCGLRCGVKSYSFSFVIADSVGLGLEDLPRGYSPLVMLFTGV
jgi:hypothetical protein